MADGKISIEFAIEGNGQLRVKQITDEIRDLGTVGTKNLNTLSASWASFTGNLAADAVMKGFEAMAKAAGAFFGELKEGIQAAIEEEDAINKLNTALRIQGQYSRETTEELQAYAAELQRSSKYTDDAIIESQAYLAALTNLDKDGLKVATKAALDLAAATGKDLSTATEMVAKAANGSVQALNKLKLGIEEGSTSAETFSNAMQKLNQKFGGSAAAAVNTYSGATDQLGKAYGEVQQAIGEVITQNPVVISLMKDLSVALYETAQWFQNNKKEISAFISGGLILCIEGIQHAVPAVQLLSTAALKMAQAWLVATGPVRTLGSYLRGWASGDGGAEAAKKSIDDTAKAILALEAAAKKVQNADELNDFLERAKVNAQAAASEDDKLATRKVDNIGKVKAAEDARDQEKEMKRQEELAEIEAERIASEERRLSIFQKEIEQTMERNRILKEIDKEKNAELIAANDAYIDELLKNETHLADTALKVQHARLQEERKIEQERVQAGKTALNDLATLQNSKSKEMAAVGKAAAITSTVISTYEGAQKAYSSLAGIPIIGPVLGAAAAGAAIAAGLGRVAAIRGTPLETGITEVPPGYPNDTFPARLTSGERVVDSGTNQDLKGFLSSGGNAHLLQEISDKLSRLELRTTVNVGNKTIIDEVRNGLRAGRVVNA